MSQVEIRVPGLPESVADATVSTWHKQPGDWVEEGESVVDLETDKIMLEVPAPQAGLLGALSAQEGDTVTSDDLLVVLDTSAQPPAAQAAPTASQAASSSAPTSTAVDQPAGPSVRRMMQEHDVDPQRVEGHGKKGRITHDDVTAHLQGTVVPQGRHEERVPMTRLRARVAERLLEVQQNAAILTTFNEVNMQPVMDLRARYKERFEKANDVRLGFMSFFVKAAVTALKKFPVVNASLDGKDIVYHNYFDVGIAVSSPRGLVVPVIRGADTLSMAEIEQTIVAYAQKAKQGTLTLEDMQGGTFTITNGGTFGSMLSTPIINPPQSGILGMHNIVKRAVVENDEVVIRPMMYLALSYDHRLIDGAQSVQFLVTIKQMLEDPARMLLDI